MTTKSEQSAGIKLTASITRKYGAVEASFGAEIIIATGTNESTLSGYGVLMDIIEGQFRHFESVNLPHENSNPAIYNQKNIGTQLVTVDCDMLHVDTYKGKTVYKITGGKWMKHGVPIYPEVLSRYRDLDKFSVGKAYPMVGWKMNVDESKTAKAVALIAPV